ncbi:MAG: hypothetical protein QM599_09975 [Pseudoxanthomonas sp.]
MSQVFQAQDQAGNQCRVIEMLQPIETAANEAMIVYKLEDGTPVRRVDNDTFQIMGTGAYVTLVAA